jgi:hypothetical protein
MLSNVLKNDTEKNPVSWTKVLGAAKLRRAAGGEPEQIQLLLRHSSVQTT